MSCAPLAHKLAHGTKTLLQIGNFVRQRAPGRAKAVCLREFRLLPGDSVLSTDRPTYYAN